MFINCSTEPLKVLTKRFKPYEVTDPLTLEVKKGNSYYLGVQAAESVGEITVSENVYNKVVLGETFDFYFDISCPLSDKYRLKFSDFK